MSLKNLLKSLFSPTPRKESPESVLAALTPSVAVWIDEKTGAVYQQIGDREAEEVTDEEAKKKIKDYLGWEDENITKLFKEEPPCN